MTRAKKNRIILYLVLVIIILISIIFLFPNKKNKEVVKKDLMIDLTNKTLEENDKFIKEYEFVMDIKYEYDDNIEKDKIISQSIDKDIKINKNQELSIVISLGKLDKEKLRKDGINELGKVPIMMYHGIVDMMSKDTKYTGGNVDKDGYNRTTEAFKEDLEFYYQNGYRMIRLNDYVKGIIDVEYGYSPIILTFDDGNDNNIKVKGLDEKGNIIIDDNCAVGILESFKKKYPDYNVTATFFINGGLFNQPEYNEKIMNFLVDNGYDIGNHTTNHENLGNISATQTQKTIALMYQKLEKILPNKYVNIIALPFGAPYNKKNDNFNYVLKGNYEGYIYETEASLRVGWEPEVSPFDKNFDKTYMKRCRAYDNNGKEFDIKMVFNNLKTNRYISDGIVDIITIPSSKKDNLKEFDKRIIEY